jgi:hypothetical protein
MKFNYKIGFFIACFLFIFFFYSLLSLEKNYYYDYDRQIDSLTTVNREILKEIELDRIVIKSYEKAIDSLEQVKKKVTIKYIAKSNEITNYSANSLVLEFDSIFSRANVK